MIGMGSSHDFSWDVVKSTKLISPVTGMPKINTGNPFLTEEELKMLTECPAFHLPGKTNEKAKMALMPNFDLLARG